MEGADGVPSASGSGSETTPNLYEERMIFSLTSVLAMIRELKKLLLAATVVGAAFTVSATANAFLFTFDEYGHGLLDGVSNPGVLAADPSSDIGVNVLTYSLGGHLVVAGDLGVCEFVECSNYSGDPNLSDIIRFTDASGTLTGVADRMIFYSDNSDDVDALADTG